MYQCNECKETFDEPQYIHDREVIDYGIGGSRWVTIFEGNVCPYCESEFELTDETQTNKQETEQ